MTKSLKAIFSVVHDRYEFVNHVLTLGLDIIWRRRAAMTAVNGNGGRWMDMCTGTGEMAVYLSRKAKKGTSIVAVDFSSNMVRMASMKPEARTISFSLANADFLPFKDNSFDLITISFATRNLNKGPNTLVNFFKEFHRVLKPGGRLVNVETSQPPSKFIKRLYHMFVRSTVRPIGSLITGHGLAYRYLSNSIQRFYDADELKNIIHKAGFEKVEYQRMSLGMAAIHRAFK